MLELVFYIVKIIKKSTQKWKKVSLLNLIVALISTGPLDSSPFD